jgi:HPt (histidine-containing phosphotransfer) domain-containing protein
MELDEIKGLDWTVGCKGVNNDKALFVEVLRTYCGESREMLERYGQYQGEDTERTIIDMHGMKSASAGIGAMEMSQEFKSMELEGKTGNLDYLAEHMETCMAHLKELSEQIQAYLDSLDLGETADCEVRPEETLSSEDLSPLIEALDEIEFEVFEEKLALLSERNFGQSINEALKKAETVYGNFEYDEARDLLAELQESLKKK